MKYIIMCGGDYHETQRRQTYEINGEQIIERTIRLLKEAGVTDIAISSLDEQFDHYGVPRLEHANDYVCGKNFWISAFYPTDYPVCYIFGDVIFSPEAIRTIVDTKSDSIEFFASAPPFDDRYIKQWAEPFAFKVQKPKQFAKALDKCKELAKEGKFKRLISWELWQVIKETPLNNIDYTNYVAINDYTCDIDEKSDLDDFIQKIGGMI